MSETVLFGKIRDPELIVLIFRGQLHCRMGGKREGIEPCPATEVQLGGGG